MLEHLNVFTMLITQLSSLDVKINDEEKTILLLTSLFTPYDHLVKTLMYGNETLKLKEVANTHIRR